MNPADGAHSRARARAILKHAFWRAFEEASRPCGPPAPPIERSNAPTKRSMEAPHHFVCEM